MRSFTRSDLGLQRFFDSRNLDYQVEDRVEATDEFRRMARNAVVMATRTTLSSLDAASGALGATAAETLSSGRHFKRHWRHPWAGHQGFTPRCTGFSGTKLRLAGPVTHPDATRGENLDATADGLYRGAQEIDRREGRVYDEGATMLALAKAMRALGWISTFYWGYSVESFILAMQNGPVLLGIDWLEGMDQPDPKFGVIRAIGQNFGGHAILANYIDVRDGMVGLDNTWGRGWGKDGAALLPLEDLDKLLRMGGELLMVDEVRSAGEDS